MCKHNECCNYCQREQCKQDFRLKINETDSKIKIVIESDSMTNEDLKIKIRGIINDIFDYKNN